MEVHRVFGQATFNFQDMRDDYCLYDFIPFADGSSAPILSVLLL